MKCTNKCPYWMKGMCTKKDKFYKIVTWNQDCIVEAEKERREWEHELKSEGSQSGESPR